MAKVCMSGMRLRSRGRSGSGKMSGMRSSCRKVQGNEGRNGMGRRACGRRCKGCR